MLAFSASRRFHLFYSQLPVLPPHCRHERVYALTRETTVPPTVHTCTPRNHAIKQGQTAPQDIYALKSRPPQSKQPHDPFTILQTRQSARTTARSLQLARQAGNDRMRRPRRRILARLHVRHLQRPQTAHIRNDHGVLRRSARGWRQANTACQHDMHTASRSEQHQGRFGLITG